MSDLALFTTAELERKHTELYQAATAYYAKAQETYDRGRTMLPRPSMAEHAVAAAAAREQHELMSAVGAELRARYAAAGGPRG